MEHTVYLDNASTTRVRPEVRDAIMPYLGDEWFGNPSSGHQFGRRVKAALEEARRRITSALDADDATVVFTSGGTEADNLAVIGAALHARRQGKPFRVAVSAIEHKAVLDAGHAVTAMGGELVLLPVDERGAVDVSAAADALTSGVALLSVMWVNNEVGVEQDVTELARLASDANTPFHTDAVQAVGKVPCSLGTLPNTLVSISGHKIGAPKGVGALLLPGKADLEPLFHGGSQQQKVRPGTENVIGAVALGLATELAVSELETVSAGVRRLRDDLERRVLERIPDASIVAREGRRAPHISTVCFPGADSASLLMHLDLAGVCCSSGSACNTGISAPSHVLTAMRVPDDQARGAVRFSFSHENVGADIDRVAAALPRIVGKVRDATGGRPRRADP